MEPETKVLPCNDAYRFGIEHGLEQAIAAIKNMEIEWDLSYTSSLRRGYLIDLFTKKQLFDSFKDECWPAGSTPWGKRKSDFWVHLKHRYEDFLAGGDQEAEDADEAEEDQAFAAEADLRDFLANNLECVEPGLSLSKQGEKSGVEFSIDGGRIDILAIDKAGRFVVFELKLAYGRNKALGQLMYYMAWVDKHLGNGPCRGIILAKDISDELTLATQRVPGVILFRYKLNVTVEKVT